MDAGAADSARRPTLAGVVFCDLPLGAEGTAAGANRIAGSAHWPFEPESVARTVVDELLHIAHSQGYAIPETLLFRAGQVFYQGGQIHEVRVAGLVPDLPDTAGQLTFTRWSTPLSPTVAEGPQGELVLHAADHGRSHFSALVVPAYLLDAVGVCINQRKPSETRTRLEKALDALLQDSVIAAWQYDRWDEALASQRGWARYWLQATILIEPPEIIRETYQRLARYETFSKRSLPSPKTLGDQLKGRRQELGLSQLQAAEQIGISPSYLNRLEQGNRGRKLTAALQNKLDAWLAHSVMAQE